MAGSWETWKDRKTDTVVDSPLLSCLLHTLGSYDALLGAACELANVAADYLAGQMVRIVGLQSLRYRRIRDCLFL
jgi:hypothetical protein